MNAGWSLNPGFENVCSDFFFPLFSLSQWIHWTVKVHKKRMKPRESFPFNMWLAEKAGAQKVLALCWARSKEESVVSTLTTLGSHEMICMHACSFTWWGEHVSISLWNPVHSCLCVCVCVCVCVWGLTGLRCVCVWCKFGAVGQVFHTARGGEEGASLSSSSPGFD